MPQTNKRKENSASSVSIPGLSPLLEARGGTAVRDRRSYNESHELQTAPAMQIGRERHREAELGGGWAQGGSQDSSARAQQAGDEAT